MVQKSGVLKWPTVDGGPGSDTTAFHDEGDSFGSDAVLGTNDAFDVAIETDGVERIRINKTSGSGFVRIDPSNDAAVVAQHPLHVFKGVGAGTYAKFANDLDTTGVILEQITGAQTRIQMDTGSVNGLWLWVNGGAGGTGIFSHNPSFTSGMRIQITSVNKIEAQLRLLGDAPGAGVDVSARLDVEASRVRVGSSSAHPFQLEANDVVGIELQESGASPLIGFFGTAPVVRPTGVAVTAAGIHAALVTLGLITA